MGNISEERINLKLDIPVKAIIRGEIICSINEHARAEFEILIQGKIDIMELSLSLKGGQMSIHEITEEGNLKILFNGYIERVRGVAEGEYITAVINGISCSAKMDKESKYCSFQQVERTYRDIADEIIGRTKKALMNWNTKDKEIGNLLVQYEESDWAFLKRVASHLECSVYTEEKRSVPNISIGVKRRQKYEWNNEKKAEYEKGIGRRYYLAGNEGGKHSDYLYYTFRSKENYDLCDWFEINGSVFMIVQKSVFFYKSELCFSYRLVKEESLSRNRIYNEKLRGITLEGEVVKTEGENIFLQLDIDEASHAEYAFQWKPIWGNMVYCMPERGERVSIQFHEADERKVSVGHAIRGNGGEEKNPKGNCSEFEQYKNKIFETTKKKQMRLFPDEISLENLKDEASENLMEVKDGKGISICSNESVHLTASGKIIFYGKRITSTAPQEIRLQGMESSIQISRNFNVYSPNGIEHCGLDDDMQKPFVTSSYKESRKWANNYYALAAIPTGGFGSSCGKTDMFTLASLPVTANGIATYAMNEIMDGKEMNETSFPQVFDNMEVRTMNGGFPPPNLED